MSRPELVITSIAEGRIDGNIVSYPINTCRGGSGNAQHQIRQYGRNRHHQSVPLPEDGCSYGISVMGKISSSQDGVVVSRFGIAPCLTAGHGNCPKIQMEY